MQAVRPGGLIGREPELVRATSLVQQVAAGTGAGLIVEGEAGIGKSSLLAAVVDKGRGAGLTVLRGGAHALDRARPFGALAEALDLSLNAADPRRAALARLLAPDDPSADQPWRDAPFQVVDRIVELVEATASAAPTVLVLEDLHWADDPTVLALRSLVSGLSHLPVLLTTSLRPSPRSPQVDQLIDDALGVGAHLIRLGSLGPVEVDGLVSATLGWPPGPLLTEIVAKAGGNPLWVVELLRSLSAEGWLRRGPEVVEAMGDELPGSLRELVLRRLRYLPTVTLELLQLAAVLGDDVPIRDLAAVAGRPATAVVGDLADAFRAGLLDEGSDAVVFRHQLVQEAIYQHLPGPTRRARHRDAAGALVRSGADLAVVAPHVLRGADRGDLEAVGWLRQAAATASASAPAVAVDLLRHAQGLLPAGHPDADRLTVELVDALMRAGLVADASTVAEGALAAPHVAEVEVPLRLALVSALSLQNRGPELIRHADAALEPSVGLTPAEQALVLTQASYGRTFSGDFRGGEAVARRAAAVGSDAGSRPMTVWGINALSVALRCQGRYAEAIAHAERAVSLASDPPDVEARERHPQFFLGMALADSDRVAEARGAYEAAVREYEALGSSWLLPDTVLLSAELRFLTGEWDDARAELESGLQLAENGQRISVAQSLAHRALMALACGDVAAARTVLRAVQHEPWSDEPCYGAEMVAVALATLEEVDGRPEGALDLLVRVWELDGTRGVRIHQRWIGPALTRLAVAAGRREIAADVVRGVEEGAALAPEVPSVVSAAQRCRGLFDGDPDRLLAAVELARAAPRLLDHAGACEDAARVLVLADRRVEATELLLEAQRLYDAVDASALVARVGPQLRELGVRPGVRGGRQRAAAGWTSLTPTQEAVCRLVAEGLTNRAVAQRLFISPHTVNTHLRHVFQKLAVSTRAELAGRVARRGDGAADHASG